MFINRRIYTDVESWKVLEVNGDTATIVRVRKNPVGLIHIPFGFCGYSPNQFEAFQNSNDIVEEGEPFEVIRRKGVWGRWVDEIMVVPGYERSDARRLCEENPTKYRMVEEDDERDTCTLIVFFLTPKGKIKRTFVKYGEMEEGCRYFYDYNF